MGNRKHITKIKSKFNLTTPAKACILLEAYINQVKRIQANTYKRENERTYDLRRVAHMDHKTLQLLTSIAKFNRRGQAKAISLGNEAWKLINSQN